MEVVPKVINIHTILFLNSQHGYNLCFGGGLMHLTPLLDPLGLVCYVDSFFLPSKIQTYVCERVCLRTSGIHARILQQLITLAVLIIAVQLPHKPQQTILLEATFQILAHDERKQVGAVQNEGHVLPTELVENAGEDDLEAALTVGHAGQSGVLALVFEDTLEGRCGINTRAPGVTTKEAQL